MKSTGSLSIPRQFALIFLVTAIALFGSAGTWLWWNGWVLLAFTVIVGVLTGSLFQKSPKLVKERKNAVKKAKLWDRILVALLGRILPFLLVILAGLDKRWAWTQSLTALDSLLAIPVMVLGTALTFWAMGSNPFFSSYVRVQKDRGHRVVSGGPYAYVRHPAYAGVILYNLAAPVLLGSHPALDVGILIVLLTLVRTDLEDQTLRKELRGYQKYAAKVRYQLIPFVW